MTSFSWMEGPSWEPAKTANSIPLPRNPPVLPSWPPWKRRLVSALLLFHLIAIGVAAASAPPASALERVLASAFGPYYDLVDQGYAYRYYAPEPPPTPVVTATVRFADGRPEVIVRLPKRGLRPRLRYQRQLALAFHLFSDFDEARRVAGDGSRSRWARAYARHLAKAWPGCATVTLFAQMHLIPDPLRVQRGGLHARGPAPRPRRRGVLHRSRTDRRVLVRRLVSGFVAYVAELSGAVARGWDAFFFTPADPTPLGLIRVAVGLLLLWSLGVYGLDLHAFLGSEDGRTPRSSASSRASGPRGRGRSGSSSPTRCSGRPGSRAWPS